MTAEVKNEEIKKCPRCAENIQSAAKKCKHCGADLRNIFARHKILSLLLIFVTLIIIIFAFGSGNEDTNSNSTIINENETKQQTETETQGQTNSQNESSKQNEPATTIDKLWIALDISIKSREGYDIIYDETKKTASITYTSVDFWDGNSLVRDTYTTFVKYGVEVFKIEGVNSLTVNNKTEFTDTYGKKSIEDAIIITMSKEEFSKYDWNGLKNQSIYQQMEASSSKYYIHPAIMKELNYDKLYLSL